MASIDPARARYWQEAVPVIRDVTDKMREIAETMEALDLEQTTVSLTELRGWLSKLDTACQL